VKAGQSSTVATWNRSIGELIMHDGTRVYIDGADDGAYRIQGLNARGCWADEIGLWKKWKAAWDESLGFALRKGLSRRIVTGTPKRNMPARQLVRRLIADPKVVSRRLRTADNLHNLSQAFIETQVMPFEGTELGKQELEGLLLEDAEGALWRRSWFEQDGFKVPEFRIPEELPAGQWQRAPVIGVDPADGYEDSDEQAYVLLGLGMDHLLYVAESGAFREHPAEFAKRVILRAREHGAIVVLEKNHGGEWLVTVFRRVMRDLDVIVPLKVVSAAQGKRTRAEPVATLYEQGHFRHVGDQSRLEDEQANFTGAPGEKSPNLLDALVWAASEFTGMAFGPPPDEQGAVRYTDRRGAGSGAVPYQGAVAWT
jgi:phage terminase large subunit-like protein